jgi:hypothetical protein
MCRNHQAPHDFIEFLKIRRESGLFYTILNQFFQVHIAQAFADYVWLAVVHFVLFPRAERALAGNFYLWEKFGMKFLTFSFCYDYVGAILLSAAFWTSSKDGNPPRKSGFPPTKAMAL